MIIPSHEMTACQHHSDVVLQSHGTSLMRYNTTCLPGSRLVCFTSLTVCFISLTDNCIVTRVAFFRLYYWRVRLFRFFLAGEFDCYWVTAEGGSDCGGGVNDLIVGGVDEIDNDDLNLTAVTLSSLVLSLSIIAFIWLVSSVIITCSAFIVTGALVVWVVDILLRLIGISLNNRMA